MYRIKIATRLDIPALKNIARECRALVTENYPFTDRLWDLSIKNHLAHILMQGEIPIGYWLGGPDNIRDELTVGIIAIRRAYQGKNLGQRLVEDIKTAAVDMGFEYAMLSVPESRCLPEHDDYVIPWLQKMGFTANGVVDRSAYTHLGENYDIYQFTTPAWGKQVWTIWGTHAGEYQVRDVNDQEVCQGREIKQVIDTARRYGHLRGLSIKFVEGRTEG